MRFEDENWAVRVETMFGGVLLMVHDEADEIGSVLLSGRLAWLIGSELMRCAQEVEARRPVA